MAGKQYAGLALVLAVLVGVGVLMQLTISPAPAQHSGKVKITGKVTDKLLKHFEGSSGVAGVRTIELRRLTMAPGATMEGEMVFEGHADLCVVQKGSVTITMANGKQVTYQEGDIYINPVGARLKVMAAHPTDGFEELMWVINLKKKH